MIRWHTDDNVRFDDLFIKQNDICARRDNEDTLLQHWVIHDPTKDNIPHDEFEAQIN